MPLPSLIEIVPLAEPVRAEITVPGSKSITNRALILAALADGETVLRGALWSEDTQVMADCLLKLGFKVDVQPDEEEACNRTITVRGLGGKIPKTGTAEKPLSLFVGNAGTAARFLAALVCLGDGVYRLHGVPRMHERPQEALFRALRTLGYRIDAEKGGDKLPVTIHGAGPRPGRCQVSIGESSQFASALELCAGLGGWVVETVGENSEESPYVVMTLALCEVFPARGGTFQIEADASSCSYFWASDWLLSVKGPNPEMNRIRVVNRPESHWQIDANYFEIGRDFPGKISRTTDLADSIMTAIVCAPISGGASPADSPVASPRIFTDLGRLRVQECERVVALRTELTRCGARVEEAGDTLCVYPSVLHGAEIETYDDHRMAMCFAILGLKVGGIKIKNPACVKKTFPNFYQKLAAAPPHGLGAAILDGVTGRVLEHDELFAE
jgi:3-phosphoshikimate 1-carboxyvinyltransferase